MADSGYRVQDIRYNAKPKAWNRLIPDLVRGDLAQGDLAQGSGAKCHSFATAPPWHRNTMAL